MGVLDFLSGLSPGTAAGQALKEVGGGIIDGVDKLIKDFKATPEQLAQWEQFKISANQRVIELANQRAELDEKDRDSARQREIAVKDKTPHRLAYLIVGSALGLTAFQIVAYFVWPDVTSKIPGPAWSMIGGLTGYMWADAKLVLAYYFGGSQSGDESHAALQTLAQR